MGSVADSNFSLSSLTEPSSNYKRKAWIALLGVMVFVTVYVFFTGWLVLSSYRFITGALQGGEGAFLAVICSIPAVFLSLFMVKALFFLQRGGDAGYLELKAEEEPELVNFIHQLADEAGAPRPHKIYLSPMVNAAVFYDLSILNFLFPSKKNLLIGLGLVNVLNRSEFKAVLAHEFGHFSQRSMAIGRWVYISEQITAHIVGARGALDRMLQFISHIDLRIAWIGWIMSLIIWSIRSFLETIYRLVASTHKALSREMEYQADLVSVSLTGSDALVNALHKLQAADEAWGLSLQFMEDEFKEKRSVSNLFAVHNRTLNHLRRVLDDPEYGVSPQIPQVNPEKFRVFKEELAQPPQMWLTHPVNSDREENAKKIYIPAEIDNNSAWDLFANPEGTKKKITADMLQNVKDVEQVPIDKTLEELDAYFGKRRYDRKYHGVYLGRDVTRHIDSADKMIIPLVCDDLIQALDDLYPDEISEKMELLRNLNEEYGLLEAIKEKQMDASGGIIQHRGRQLQRSELPNVLKNLKAEIKEVEGYINQHENRCRSLHRQAAACVGWDKFHDGSCRLLHYAEHSLANIADLAGVMGNTVAIVLADGRVSSKELEQVLTVGGRLQRAIKKIYEKKKSVIVSPGVAEEMKMESWDKRLEDLKLPAPTRENINEWMQVIDGWIQGTLIDLGELRTAALNQLLKTEEEIVRTLVKSNNRETTSPQPIPKVPGAYDTLLKGDERELQNKLGWWDSFHVADGPISLTLRLAVACAIIGSLIFLGTNVGSNDLHIYNGLNTTVEVSVDDQKMTLGPAKTRKMTLPLGVHDIKTNKQGSEQIEALQVNVDKAFTNTVYNVAGASPMMEYVAVYGNAGKETYTGLGNVKILNSGAEYIFTEPPRQVKSSGSGTTKTALRGFAEFTPYDMLSILKDKGDPQELIKTHAIWDEPSSRHYLIWLHLAGTQEDFKQTAAHRLKIYPGDIATLRTVYDNAEDAEKAVMVSDWRKKLKTDENPDLVYLILRDQKDSKKRNDALIASFKKYPQHAWLAYSAAHAYLAKRQYKSGIKALSSAEKYLPGLKIQTALLRERIRRYTSRSMTTFSDKLYEQSYSLYILTARENSNDEYFKAFHNLHRGNLSQALKIAPAKQKNLILRLVAMSDGASKEWIRQALALPTPEDEDELWFSYAIKLRAGKDISDETKKLLEFDDPDYQEMIKFLKTVKDGNMNTDLLDEVDIVNRAKAYSFARFLGVKNNELTRFAKYILFTGERPFIR